jgi:hypothetical protein
MPFRIAAIIATLVIALFPTVQAGGKASKKAVVTFHIQVDANENPKMVFAHVMDGQNMVFRRSAEVSLRDIAGFSPFAAEAGGDYGAVFRLKGNAAGRFSAITNANQGRWLAAMVNGRIVDGVFIDKQIDDGVIVVWNNLTLEDIASMEAALPRLDGVKKN